MYTQNAIIQEAQQGSLSVLLSCFCIYEPCMQITVDRRLRIQTAFIHSTQCNIIW